MRIVCAPTAAAEVDLAAREALRLAREEGYRFGEIGFVARDLAPYHDLIRAALARLRIPFFLDRPREAACHPLTEFLAAAAQVVAGGWRTSDVVQALKTDLLPLSRDDADRLENRALALGLDGADWRNPARWEEELAAWENATAPLRAFDDACRKTETGGVRAEAFVEALHALLDAIGAGETIERWATDAEAAGAWEAAAEHRQTAQAIQSLLDEWAEGLRGALLSLRECADLLAEGLDSIRLRLVPPSLDQLLVGAIERSRHPELRAVFVLGLNDRVFPREPADDPILGEADRRALTEDGLELGPSATERLLREPFLAYIAFTRPSERLILSYVAAEPSGRKMAPSVFLDRVRAILPDVEIEAFVGEGQGAVERICDATSLGGETAAALGEALARGADPPAPWPALVDLGRERDGADRAFSRRIAGALYRNRASLDAEWAARLYETLGAISPSRLESQAACGFQCFAKYGLGLQERAVFQLEAVDRGTFCHRVLAEVFRRLKRAGRTWHEADEAELLAWLNEAIDQQAAELRGGLLRGTARNRFLVETFRRALTERTRALRDESAASDFRQEYAEAGFGFDGSPLPALEIEASESARLRLQGVIDRIDLARLPEDGWAARIWDYKSGAGGFWPALARHGVQLQLPAYLLAMVRGASARGRRILPAGFFYSPLFAPLQTIVAGGEEDEEEEAPSPRAAGFRARGLFDAALAASMDRTMAGAGVSKFWAIRRNKNGSLSKDERQCDSVTAEELQAALGHCERLLRELARAMTTGAIDVAPYRCGPRAACQWCAYRPVCRFDPRREPWRDLPNEKRAEMLERIRDL